jgi:YD repeat-containing protein
VPAADQPRLVQPVVDRIAGAGRTSWTANRPLGTIDHGQAGPQGASPAPGALLPVTLRTPLPARATTVTARFTGGESSVDALLLRPEVSQVVFDRAALLQSASTGPRTRAVAVPAATRVTALSYDGRGRLLHRSTLTGPTVRAPVAAGGFTVLRW